MIYPAYPTTRDLARERRAAGALRRAIENNKRIAAILQQAMADLSECDLTGPSMVPGYDLADIIPTIRDMLPQFDGERMEMMARQMLEEVE